MTASPGSVPKSRKLVKILRIPAMLRAISSSLNNWRDETRQLLSDEEIARNMAGIRKIFTNFLDFGTEPGDAVMVNNADWLDELRYIPVLRDIGRYFSVNRMLTQD